MIRYLNGKQRYSDEAYFDGCASLIDRFAALNASTQMDSEELS